MTEHTLQCDISPPTLLPSSGLQSTYKNLKHEKLAETEVDFLEVFHITVIDFCLVLYK